MKDKVILVQMLIEKIEQYAKTSVELYKLKAIDKATDIFSSVVSMVLIFAFITLFFLLATIGLSLYLGEVLGKAHYGFFVVAGFYLLIGIVLFATRKSFLETGLNDYIVREIFKEKKR